MQNTLPDGSTWDGKSDLPMDEATFKQMVSEIEPGTAEAAAGSAAAATPTAAGSPPKTRPAAAPKNGS